MQVREAISEELEAHGKASCGLVAERKQKLQSIIVINQFSCNTNNIDIMSFESR